MATNLALDDSLIQEAVRISGFFGAVAADADCFLNQAVIKCKIGGHDVLFVSTHRNV